MAHPPPHQGVTMKGENLCYQKKGVCVYYYQAFASEDWPSIVIVP